MLGHQAVKIAEKVQTLRKPPQCSGMCKLPTLSS